MTLPKITTSVLTLSTGSLLTVFSTYWIVLGVFLDRHILYFPGDPPYLDVSLVPAATGAICFAVGIWVMQRLPIWNRRPAIRHSSVLGLTASLLAVAVCLAGVAFRFTPRWRGVREGIRQHAEQIAAAAGGRRQLSPEEFVALRQRYMPDPIQVDLSGYGTVRLRMAHGIYPYIGVDFNDSEHALFDLPTMWCRYSD
jgi:hypothetical protein